MSNDKPTTSEQALPDGLDDSLQAPESQNSAPIHREEWLTREEWLRRAGNLEGILAIVGLVILLFSPIQFGWPPVILFLMIPIVAATVGVALGAIRFGGQYAKLSGILVLLIVLPPLGWFYYDGYYLHWQKFQWYWMEYVLRIS